MTMRLKYPRFKRANPIRISSFLETLVTDLGIGEDIYLKDLEKKWSGVVGEANARNTKPVSIRNGILTIAVSSPVWMTQTRFYKKSFLNNVRDFRSNFNVNVTDIRFVVKRFDRSET